MICFITFILYFEKQTKTQTIYVHEANHASQSWTSNYTFHQMTFCQLQSQLMTKLPAHLHSALHSIWSKTASFMEHIVTWHVVSESNSS